MTERTYKMHSLEFTTKPVSLEDECFLGGGGGGFSVEVRRPHVAEMRVQSLFPASRALTRVKRWAQRKQVLLDHGLKTFGARNLPPTKIVRASVERYCERWQCLRDYQLTVSFGA